MSEVDRAVKNYAWHEVELYHQNVLRLVLNRRIADGKTISATKLERSLNKLLLSYRDRASTTLTKED